MKEQAKYLSWLIQIKEVVFMLQMTILITKVIMPVFLFFLVRLIGIDSIRLAQSWVRVERYFFSRGSFSHPKFDWPLQLLLSYI